MNLTIKSSKPPVSFTIQVSPIETIATIKDLVAASPGGPPHDVQRLLFKGKALADGKLLKEYSISDGDTVNIMTKPGYVWEAPTPKPSDPIPPPPSALQVRNMDTLAIPMEETERIDPLHKRSGSRSGSRSHSRSNSINIPDLVLSPTPQNSSPMVLDSPQPVLLTVDSAAVSTPTTAPGSVSSYQKTMSQPSFWANLYGFLKKEFDNRDDAATAFEDFLLASKGNLTAHQIAAIRDAVGVHGMAGT